MKTIKVFIASSEELRMERLEFTDMIQQLNRILKPRGIEIEPVKWEYLDASMGPLHKQEEYNNELKTCEICLALYWTKFGEYTKSELDTAYEELKAGRNPRKLYVYFKDTDNITPELKEFKDSFATRYGHFFCRFENVDTMRLNFLLQFEDYQNQRNESLLKVRDSKVEIDGKPLVALRSVPFCGNNPEYLQLLKDIEKAQARVLKYPDEIEFKQELHDLKEKCGKMEQSLLDTAKLITKLSYTASSARLTEAIRLFEQGDNRGANAVLNLAEIGRDAEANIARIDAARELETEARKALETNIEEYQLKIKTISSEMAEGWVNEVISVYTKAVELARGHISQEKFAELLLNYAYFLTANKLSNLVGNLFNECLDIYRKLAEYNPDVYMSKVAITLNILAIMHNDNKRFREAEQEWKEALNISKQVYETHPEEVHMASIASILNNLAMIYYNTMRFDEAEEAGQNALSLSKALVDSNPDLYTYAYILVLNGLGLAHCTMQEYQQAEAEFIEALNLFTPQLKEKDSLNYKFHISIVLSNMGNLYNSMNKYEAAEKYFNESLDINRQLAETRPQVHMSFVAQILNNLGVMHMSNQEYKKAEKEHIEALKITKQLAELNHETFIGQVAQTLSYLGHLHIALQDYQQAAKEFTDALSIFRQIAESNLEVMNANVAATLSTLGELHSLLQHYEQAEVELLEACQIYTQLADDEPAFIVNLAATLNSLGDLFSNVQQYQQAEDEYNAALNIYRLLTDDVPEPDLLLLSKLAETLNNMGALHFTTQRFQEAENEVNEALQIFRKLAIIDHNAYLPKVAITLNILGTVYSTTEQYAEALDCGREASAIYQELSTHTDIYHDEIEMLQSWLEDIKEM